MEDNKQPPRCHMKEMVISEADDEYSSVIFWECAYCGHTKEINSSQRS